MNWTCPYCNRAQTITPPRISKNGFTFSVGDTAIGFFGLRGQAICCANELCLKASVRVWLQPAGKYPHGGLGFEDDLEPILSHQLLPESLAKPQPDFIPEALRQDYLEACRIRDLSPKASATLSRRCLQGMIRDFCNIKKGRLIDEINELKKRVDEERAPKGVSDDSVEAIDAVRQIGNIGAHMEKDINLIIDVEPDEAQTLLELIETLFDEWYVEREKRLQRFAKIGAIAASKKEQKTIAQDVPLPISAPDDGNE